MTMSLDVAGFLAAIERKTAAVGLATRDATHAGALAIEREAKLNLRKSSHRKGTPTPSAPGSPPAKVSGGLGRSVVSTAPSPTGTGGWQAKAGVAAGSEAQAYAEAQETGNSRLPARPYFAPAVTSVIASGAITAIYRERVERAWRS